MSIPDIKWNNRISYFITKGFLSFTFGRLKLYIKISSSGSYSHSFTTTSSNSFDHQRITNFLSFMPKSFYTLIFSMITIYNRYSRSRHDILWSTIKIFISYINYQNNIKLCWVWIPLNSHITNSWGRRTYKYNSFIWALFSKFYIFREESITRMDCLGSCFEGSFKYSIFSQIALCWSCWS